VYREMAYQVARPTRQAECVHGDSGNQ
jgi:hypothetical protein